jgi:hypothetical protein
MKIELSHGKSVLVNQPDDPRHGGWKIYPVKRRNNWYALVCRWNTAGKFQQRMWLHRYVMNADKGQMVCHLNGNGLDCRKSNLSIGDHHLNGSSFRSKRVGAASKYRGVQVNRGRGKPWTTMFWDNGKVVYLGRYSTQKAAATAYDVEAKKRFGKFAHLNFK